MLNCLNLQARRGAAGRADFFMVAGTISWGKWRSIILHHQYLQKICTFNKIKTYIHEDNQYPHQWEYSNTIAKRIESWRNPWRLKIAWSWWLRG
jgi:hypothetical protein